MKKLIFLAVFILAAISLITVVSSAQKQRNPLRHLLGSDQFDSYGLEKLNDAEIDGLFKLCSPRAGRDFLGQSAVRFMENNGWRQVNIIGAYMPETIGSEENHLVVIDNYDLAVLDPWERLENLPNPGYYWAKNSLSSWEIIFPDGKIYSFKMEDI